MESIFLAYTTYNALLFRVPIIHQAWCSSLQRGDLPSEVPILDLLSLEFRAISKLHLIEWNFSLFFGL